jgi:hypothetical protein
VSRVRAAVFGVALSLASPAIATAQLEQWLNPTLGESKPEADYRLTLYPDQPVRDQPTHIKWVEQRVTFSTPLFQNPRDELSLIGYARGADLNHDAVLPDVGPTPLPDELYNIRFGPAYRHRFDNGWVGGGVLQVGSASDKPFDSEEELTVLLTTFLRIPSGERNAWLVSLNYTNMGEFLGNAPFPGLAYIYSPSDKFQAVIGVPFTSIRATPHERVIINLHWVPVRTVAARLIVEIFRPLRFLAGFDWDNDAYFRADREDKEDKLFYYEKRVTAGFRFDLRHVGLELTGGYAFDRFFFEGERYADNGKNRIDVDDSFFGVAKLNFRFYNP